MKPCRLWAGSLTNGYGQTYLPGRGTLRVHRLAWESLHGSIPDGMQVCHHCDVRNCYEPTHLFLGTQSDNMRDAWRKGRGISNWPHVGERHPRAKLTDAAVAEIRATVPRRKPWEHTRDVAEAARRYGVSRATIARILAYRGWTNEQRQAVAEEMGLA